MVVIAAILLVLVFGGIFFFSIYNALVGLDAETKRAWANIDVILKQRFDEIPQIISVVEQFASYEKDLIGRLLKARQNYGQAQSADEKIQADGQLSLAMNGVFALGENYPELKSNQNFLHLQKRISDLEESLAHRRETFNEAATIYNTRIIQVPDIIAARLLNFNKRILLQVPKDETVRPNLQMKIGG